MRLEAVVVIYVFVGYAYCNAIPKAEESTGSSCDATVNDVLSANINNHNSNIKIAFHVSNYVTSEIGTGGCANHCLEAPECQDFIKYVNWNNILAGTKYNLYNNPVIQKCILAPIDIFDCVEEIGKCHACAQKTCNDDSLTQKVLEAARQYRN